MIEHRQEPADIFQAVQEAVTALREELPGHTSPRDLIREAWMRKMIRAAQKENFDSCRRLWCMACTRTGRYAQSKGR